MGKIRVLVVDDAAVVRRMISDVLAGDPALEVVGTAANGHIALARIPQLKPDIVTLDIEMPVMNGLEALTKIRQTYPRLPVLMFSAQTQRGAVATIEALSLGARDYVAKPASGSSISETLQRLRDELIPKIKMLCERTPEKADDAPAARSNGAGSAWRTRANVPRIEILAIGVSTGGPYALTQVLSQLPASFPVPIVIVQHMPPLFTRFLAERLTEKSRLLIAEGLSGKILTAGSGWIAPGDFHMETVREDGQARLWLHQETAENSCRPSVDVLFRSAAKAYGAGVLAVVMTGMGQDGLRGCEKIREAGGQVLVQDEASSVVWGMPGAVAKAGLAQQIVPLPELAGQIVHLLQSGRDKQDSKWKEAP